ncbi:MAG: IS110 family transposase [Prevotellaceae bacterium]|jgi:transposase|nr:IS110 family transposase [Prevotellaceae bacterium]
MDKCCGLDVHKDSIFACILDEQGKKISEKRYGTLTPDLTQLRDTLVEHGCGRAAMESTSIYWKPIWRMLQSDISLKLANPYFIRQLPGRKSDVKDAQWIAECLQKELIRGSFVPEEVTQQMRQYTRQCRRLTKSRVRLEQQMDNQLQQCNIRFSNYVSNQGNNVSLRKIIKAIIEGERDPVKLGLKVHGRTKNKHGAQTITDSLDGVISAADVEMLKQCMDQLELLEKQQAACLTHLEELANKHFAKEISLLCTIPGIQKFSAYVILSEIGNDMSAFGKASNLVGWAGLRPRNDESAGKIQSRKTLHGNKYLRQILVEISWSAAKSNKTFLGKKHSHLSKRMKSQKALLAITRKILVIVYNVLNTGQPFDPKKNRQAFAA